MEMISNKQVLRKTHTEGYRHCTKKKETKQGVMAQKVIKK